MVPGLAAMNGGTLKLDRAKLQRARKMLGYAIETVAEQAGISKNSVLRAEHEEDIRPVTARKIAAALGVRVADLIGESESLKVQAPLPEFPDERRVPSLRSWIDFAGRMADRWEAEFEEREAEWQAAEPHIKRNVKRLPNLSWATEILRTYNDILAAVNTELHYGLYVYETAEVQEVFRNTQRLEEVWERTKPWYSGQEAPRMAEVIDLQRAMAERVAQITARNSQSA